MANAVQPQQACRECSSSGAGAQIRGEIRERRDPCGCIALTAVAGPTAAGRSSPALAHRMDWGSGGHPSCRDCLALRHAGSLDGAARSLVLICLYHPRNRFVCTCLHSSLLWHVALNDKAINDGGSWIERGDRRYLYYGGRPFAHRKRLLGLRGVGAQCEDGIHLSGFGH